MVVGGRSGNRSLGGHARCRAGVGCPRRWRQKIPEEFLLGIATAAHQIEGNNLNADYWLLENAEPTAFKERSGDTCDSYHRYEEDIALLAGLGFNSYRFSLEWARIEPTRGHFQAPNSTTTNV
jgi:beta-glucosidase